jgi:chlorobactene glucosyltransferase
MTSLLLIAPWIIAVLILPFLFRRRPALRDFPSGAAHPPLVSIIVPARNEAANIAPCLATLLNSQYRRREIIVVNDGSTDETETIARAMAERAQGELRVISTLPLPDGWLGKSWACWSGYREARGELLLFTDADTRHDDELLGFAVGAWSATRAGLVSLLPRQLMMSFWERVVLPQIFVPIHMRFLGLRRMSPPRSPRLAIANGQFMLMSRRAYEAIGGHQAVQHEVVEDMRLAQLMIQANERVLIADAQDLMETRMYTSLSEIAEGWTKNLDRGARLSFPAGLGRIALLAGAAAQLALWVVPPLLLLLGVFVPELAGFRLWAALATAAGALFWLTTYAFLRTSVLHAFFFPLGALVAAYLLVWSSLRGDRVEWRGRDYRLRGI